MQTIQKVNLVVILLFTHSEKIFGKVLPSTQRGTADGSLAGSQSNVVVAKVQGVEGVEGEGKEGIFLGCVIYI
jgi:hypothetical protein